MTDTRTAPDASIAALTRSITLTQPIDRVWRAITDPAEVAQWFPTTAAEWELAPGGVGTLVWNDDDGGDYIADVRIETVEPTTRFSYHWGRKSSDQPMTFVEFTLAEAGGGTELTVRETGFTTPEDRADNDEGWASELGELVDYLRATA